ncbi:hypothetical protein V5F41_01285 [Xanthobacter autotrophicus]|uniref:hypothetical protein n=1 Tax=Xanthobacter autotrophicus TaxID=280 RepID=UPI00372BB75D
MSPGSGSGATASLLGGLGGEAGLSRLLREAEHRQIDVAQDSKLRLAEVLARYADAGLAFADGEEAGVVVAGVLARSSRDERALRELVRGAWRTGHPTGIAHLSQPEPSSRGPEPEDPAVAAARRAAQRRRAALAAGLMLLTAGTAALLWWGLRGGAPTPVITDAQPAVVPLALDTAIADLLLRAAVALPALIAAWIVWERRRVAADDEDAPSPGAIARWLPETPGLVLFTSLAVRRSLEQLRRPLRIRSRRLDVRRSVCATAQAGGVPRLHFEERRVALDCVVLVERAGRTDHVAALGVQLAGRLREAGAPVMHYEFSGSPALVTRIEPGSGTRGAPVPFERFAFSHARARLLLVSSGNAFLDPRTLALSKFHREALDAFAQVYLLSPAPRRSVGGRLRQGGAGEAAFRSGMAERAFGHAGARVVAADAAGIAAVAASALAPPGDDGALADETPDLPDRLVSALDTRLPLYLAEHALPSAPDNGADAPLATAELSNAEVSELVASLRGYMGSRAAFRLLTAVLIFPRLHPDLTAAIATALAAPAPVGRGGAMEPLGPRLTEDLYLRIARLPWGRETKAPAWLRLALARALTDVERTAVAQALDRVTAQLAADPQSRDPERVVLTPDDSARIGHPAGLPARDPVFAAFRSAGDPLHIGILAPRLADGRADAPASAARRGAIGALVLVAAAGYVFAETIIAELGTLLSGPATIVLGWATSLFAAIAALLPSGLGNTAGDIFVALALLIGLLWLLFPYRIALATRTYREPDPEAVNQFLNDVATRAGVRAREWLEDAGRRLRGTRRPEVK